MWPELAPAAALVLLLTPLAAGCDDEAAPVSRVYPQMSASVCAVLASVSEEAGLHPAGPVDPDLILDEHETDSVVFCTLELVAPDPYFTARGGERWLVELRVDENDDAETSEEELDWGAESGLVQVDVGGWFDEAAERHKLSPMLQVWESDIGKYQQLIYHRIARHRNLYVQLRIIDGWVRNEKEIERVEDLATRIVDSLPEHLPERTPRPAPTTSDPAR